MKNPGFKFIYSIFLILAVLTALPAFSQQQQNRRPPNPTDEQIQQRVPDGVTFVPNIAYREGNDEWKLDLAMPSKRGDEPRPAIVFIHGGGWRNGDKRAEGFLNPTLAYAAKGYVCITVNYRLLTGNSTAIHHCVEDVKNAVRWLRAHAETYNVDPNRIGATGNSAGAHLSVMLGICPKDAGLEGDGPYQEFSSDVQAVAASATPTSFLIPMSARARERFEQEKATLDSTRDALRQKISPITYVSADVPPMMLFHEASDNTVGVYQSDTFIQALRDAGAKDVNYMLFGDGSGHGVFQRNIAVTEPSREAFFARILKPGE
ncbi:MAG: alpha/beta hydrolase [Verrucomicrobia bacterium]|nr:alpha/beta hydrolase [Verrucomicrobiota bacterium]MDA1068230.1 alpha/beta hydrolase [Verrucomicrobiota bacterium]